MVDTRRWGGGSLLVCVSLLLAACGGSGSGSPEGPAADPGAGTTSAAPAGAPGGATAREVAYRCASGRRATVVVDVPDPADLAGLLNRMQPCEYDGGFESGSVQLSCGSGRYVVRLAGRGGLVVQPSPDRLCP